MENRGIEYGQIQGIAEKASRAAYLTIKKILDFTHTVHDEAEGQMVHMIVQ